MIPADTDRLSQYVVASGEYIKARVQHPAQGMTPLETCLLINNLVSGHNYDPRHHNQAEVDALVSTPRWQEAVVTEILTQAQSDPYVLADRVIRTINQFPVSQDTTVNWDQVVATRHLTYLGVLGRVAQGVTTSIQIPYDSLPVEVYGNILRAVASSKTLAYQLPLPISMLNTVYPQFAATLPTPRETLTFDAALDDPNFSFSANIEALKQFLRNHNPYLFSEVCGFKE
jgi:hypothetical protein